MVQIHFATTNSGKILELERISTNLPTPSSSVKIPIISVKKLDISTLEEPKETGLTFSENAEIKFLYYEQFSKKLNKHEFLIAEDSGFEIIALEGFPSIYSARFLKQFSTKKEAFLEIGRMLKEKDLPIEGQKARFVCDICTRINGKISHFEGSIEGKVSFSNIETDTIEKGFGYDPIFIPENSNLTFATMEGIEKDKFSHRAKAFWQFLNFIS